MDEAIWPDGAFVDAGCALLGLPLEPAWRPAVLANLKVILAQAAILQQEKLPDGADPAPVFAA